MAKSRTANTFYNFITSIFGQLLSIVLQFAVRTVFIQTLGKSYLGINGLFSNILQMLSLAELGVGSAILFKLYEPLAKDDKKRITILLKFYKKVYQIIGLVITILGLCIIPFLRFIISDYDSLSGLGINAVLVYLLFLFQTVSSYFFFAYKSAIVKADQKEYKLTITNYFVVFAASILQMICLVLFHNFELYVIISVLQVITYNYICARIAKKLYPYINNKVEESISKEERKNIFKDCEAIFLYKINGVVLKATDNIVISMFLGLSMVGLYSNYYIFYTTISTIFTKVFESAKHSLGNLHTTKDYNREYMIFKSINLISIVLGATAGIGIACVSNQFIDSWVGKEWLIAQPFAILMGIEIYGLALRRYLSIYRSSMGLFQQAKYRPLAGMIINIVVSILLVKKLGIAGVLLGTIIADWLTIMWYDPLIIHRYGFKDQFDVKKFYLKNLFYIALTLVLGFLSYMISTHIAVGMGWLSVLVHSMIICAIVPTTFIALSYKTEEGQYFIKKMKRKKKKI